MKNNFKGNEKGSIVITESNSKTLKFLCVVTNVVYFLVFESLTFK